MEKEFSRVRSAQDIIISLILTVAGAILVAMPTSTSVNIIGFFLIITGLVLILVLKTSYRLDGTRETYRKSEKFFPQSKKDSFTNALKTSPENMDISEENKGNGLRLDIFYNHKTGKAYCRLYEYIPYRYEPCSPYFEYSIDKVAKLIR